MKYTHHNNELTMNDINKTVFLKGFVRKKRDLGNLVFVDLRDSEGLTQLAFDADNPLKAQAEKLKTESVIEVGGHVRERSSKNPNLHTGDIEIDVDTLHVLSLAKQSPMLIQDDTDALEDTRLKYRYLDLRRPYLQNILKTRHKITATIRDFLNSQNFYDIETPYLTRSTPEGARDYVVPSRNYPGNFYALPQSPQIFKQLLMVGGFEKYYQIARCFRDEDLRADRQPEFTQIDIEMAFVSEDDVMRLSEGMIKALLKKIKGIELKTPFPRLTYQEALKHYGTDKPDTRFAMKLITLNDIFKKTDFKVFKTVLDKGGLIKGLPIKNGAKLYSRKNIDQLTKDVAKYGAKGLAFFKMQDHTLSGPVTKFMSEAELTMFKSITKLEEGDMMLVVADKANTTNAALAYLRNRIAKEQGLIDDNEFDFTWVTDWPMFEYNEEEERYQALHHPFTKVHDQDKDRIKDAPSDVLAYGYDLVAQGQELGGGSLRIHELTMQNDVFTVLGMDETAIRQQFGFFVDALQYGTPPHGGIAFGLDRLVMILTGTKNMRDVIAFPKTASAHCLLSDAPGEVSDEQLKALGLKRRE